MVLGKGWEGACSRCERFFIWMQPGGRARWHWNLLCPEYSSCVLTLLSPKCRLKAGSGALLTLEMEKVSEERSEDHWKPVDTQTKNGADKERHTAFDWTHHQVLIFYKLNGFNFAPVYLRNPAADDVLLIHFHHEMNNFLNVTCNFQGFQP